MAPTMSFLILQPQLPSSVCCIWRITKGFDNILLALAKLDRKDFELHAVGAWDNDEFKARCERLVSENSLPVIFHPPASGETKFKHLAEADGFIFTPRAPEGHPWVIVEAMAAGLPIIATDQGAIVESVLHGQNGFIVPVDEPGTLADHLCTWIDQPEFRKEMGKRSRSHYEANFTEEKMVKRLREVFNRTLNPSN